MLKSFAIVTFAVGASVVYRLHQRRHNLTVNTRDRIKICVLGLGIALLLWERNRLASYPVADPGKTITIIESTLFQIKNTITKYVGQDFVQKYSLALIPALATFGVSSIALVGRTLYPVFPAIANVPEYLFRHRYAIRGCSGLFLSTVMTSDAWTTLRIKPYVSTAMQMGSIVSLFVSLDDLGITQGSFQHITLGLSLSLCLFGAQMNLISVILVGILAFYSSGIHLKVLPQPILVLQQVIGILLLSADCYLRRIDNDGYPSLGALLYSTFLVISPSSGVDLVIETLKTLGKGSYDYLFHPFFIHILEPVGNGIVWTLKKTRKGLALLWKAFQNFIWLPLLNGLDQTGQQLRILFGYLTTKAKIAFRFTCRIIGKGLDLLDKFGSMLVNAARRNITPLAIFGKENIILPLCQAGKYLVLKLIDFAYQVKGQVVQQSYNLWSCFKKGVRFVKYVIVSIVQDVLIPLMTYFRNEIVIPFSTWVRDDILQPLWKGLKTLKSYGYEKLEPVRRAMKGLATWMFRNREWILLTGKKLFFPVFSLASLLVVPLYQSSPHLGFEVSFICTFFSFICSHGFATIFPKSVEGINGVVYAHLYLGPWLLATQSISELLVSSSFYRLLWTFGTLAMDRILHGALYCGHERQGAYPQPILMNPQLGQIFGALFCAFDFLYTVHQMFFLKEFPLFNTFTLVMTYFRGTRFMRALFDYLYEGYPPVGMSGVVLTTIGSVVVGYAALFRKDWTLLALGCGLVLKGFDYLSMQWPQYFFYLKYPWKLCEFGGPRIYKLTPPLLAFGGAAKLAYLGYSTSSVGYFVGAYIFTLVGLCIIGSLLENERIYRWGDQGLHYLSVPGSRFIAVWEMFWGNVLKKLGRNIAQIFRYVWRNPFLSWWCSFATIACLFYLNKSGLDEKTLQVMAQGFEVLEPFLKSQLSRSSASVVDIFGDFENGTILQNELFSWLCLGLVLIANSMRIRLREIRMPFRLFGLPILSMYITVMISPKLFRINLCVTLLWTITSMLVIRYENRHREVMEREFINFQQRFHHQQHRPQPVATLATLPDPTGVKVFESEQCIICYDEWEKNAKPTILLCGHQFHGACIGEWLESHQRCPICRQPVMRAANTVHNLLAQ